jgi:ABC-2 type transport system permease protein
MNAVAGEKESGTAAMVLSKPMPRWAFIFSKFSAQSLVYLAAFLVAGPGTYYYTVLLFGLFDPGNFAAINLLLFAWLLAYVGAALLGSVIGGTTAAAGGFGIAFAVAIMAAGSIPQYVRLLPAGLMAWASMLGAGQTIGQTGMPSNAGAPSGTAVWILVCLLWSIALFERQEI